MSEETFLYPRSIQFPFDQTCTDIINNLEARDWQAPGFNVRFRSYGGYRYVDALEGDEFRLWFGRIQGRLSRDYNDVAAVKQLNIPRQELHVYDDNSGPSYYRYVGDDWSRDEQIFVNGSKVNSKLYHEPRTYLRYKGAWKPQGRDTLFGGALIVQQPYERGIAPYLVHDNDLGGEYDLGRGDVPYYETKKVMVEFDNWLKANVLAPLTKD